MNGSTLCRHPGTIDGQPVTIQKCQVRRIAHCVVLFAGDDVAFELFVLYNVLTQLCFSLNNSLNAVIMPICTLLPAFQYLLVKL